MKRIPFLAAVLTAVLLTLCLLESHAHGINPPLEWDTAPAWWQSDVLAHAGWWLRIPSIYCLLLIAPRSDSDAAIRSILGFSELLTVGIMSLALYYVTRFILRHLRPGHAAAVVCLIAVVGCASSAPTPDNIQGKYELRGKYIYAGESFEIRGDTFSYSRFSDVVDDPSIQGMPVRGRYTLSGSTITFHHIRVRDPQRTFERRLGRFTLWTPAQLAEHAKTGKTPLDVLYQVR